MITQATDIDYSDVDEICGYQMLALRMFERDGGFSHPYKTNATIRAVQAQGLIWLKSVRNVIDGIVSGTSTALTLAAIPKLLSSYELFYRICHGAPANEYVRSVRLQTANRWAKGDKSIPETYLVLELMREIDRDNLTLDNRYSMFAIGAFDDWIKELCHYGRFSGIPQAEAYARLRYMISRNLFAFMDSKTEEVEKKRWITNNTLTDNELDALDANTLEQYTGFALSAAMHNKQPDEHEDLSIRLLTRLAARPTLHPYHSEAIALDLSRYTLA